MDLPIGLVVQILNLFYKALRNQWSTSQLVQQANSILDEAEKAIGVAEAEASRQAFIGKAIIDSQKTELTVYVWQMRCPCRSLRRD